MCLTEKDFQFEKIQKERTEEALKALLQIIEDDNSRYLEYLGTPCSFFDVKCKKERKRIKPDQIP